MKNIACICLCMCCYVQILLYFYVSYQAIFTQPIYNTNGLLDGENTQYGTKQFVALSK